MIFLKSIKQISLIGLLAFGTSCGVTDKNEQLPFSQFGSLSEIPVRIALRTGPQILQNITSTLGIPVSSILNAYNTNSGSLPFSPLVVSMKSGTIQANGNVWSAGCAEVEDIEDNLAQNQRRFFAALELGNNSERPSAAAIDQLLQTLVEEILIEDWSSFPTQTKNELRAAAGMMLDDSENRSTRMNEVLAIGMCSYIGSFLQTLLI